ncbi:MAG: hemerythrin domain-containing protein [Deltaproteobacteria bacterium]|nr:hemerythrin domain-containing protein [Deltaproteobacteria bacterium]
MRLAGALKQLSQEHRLIEQVLGTIDGACQALRDGAPLDSRFFFDAVDFVRTFADGWHHAREEGQLVAVLDECGVSHEQVPVGEALDDHRRGRAYVGLLAAAVARLGEGSRLAAADVIGAASLYTALLRRHIAMEDRMLYPLATAALEPVARDELAARFAVEERRLGADTPLRYRELAESLQRRLEVAVEKSPGPIARPGARGLSG